MPKKFIEAVKAIKKAIRIGEIPKTYLSHGHRLKSNPYALARKITGFKGSTREK